MKTNLLKNKYLPKGISVHIIIILFCAVFTPLWGLFIGAELKMDFLISTFLIMMVDIEIMGVLSVRIFRFGENHTRKELTRIYISRLVFFIIAAVIICTLVFILFVVLGHLIKGLGFPDLLEPRMIGLIKGVAKITAIALLLSTPIFFFGQWQSALKREFKLKEQNLIFQTETLKNQINPHFLFNSLNTLSSLINTQTEIAENFVGRLSSIYRYILENSTKDSVSLNAELAFIKDYFFLHKIRDDEKIKLEIDIEDAESYEILPVSLQLLIENAIKHNMKTRENPLKILIHLEKPYIVVKNNLQKMASQLKSTRTGLKNLRERVKLITGMDLIIEETNDEYIVKVPLIS